MTRSSVDRILDCIDSGPQTAMPDPTFGEVSPRNVHKCAHCFEAEPAEDSDWCDPCRAYLLGDSKVDPAHRKADPLEAAVRYVADWFGINPWYWEQTEVVNYGFAVADAYTDPMHLRCFGGPLDGETRTMRRGQLILDVLVPPEPGYWVQREDHSTIGAMQYRVERLYHLVSERTSYGWYQYPWVTYALVAEGYSTQRITEMLNIVVALPRFLNLWGQP